MSELDYKNYSLSQLDNWINDALSAAEATPSDIYNTIIDVVVEYRDHHRDSMIKANQLLQMMRGGRPVSNSVQYTDAELNAMCAKASYDEKIKQGYEMTADGFWIKEDN